MNDHDAMTAINEALDHWFGGEISEFQVLSRIAYISGQNITEHEAAS